MNTKPGTSTIRALKSRLRKQLRDRHLKGPDKEHIKEQLRTLELEHPTKPTGRPQSDPEHGRKSPTIHFRLRMPVFRKLKETAATTGRAVNEEAQFQLERGLLGAETGTADDIKKSFRELAKSLHPDANNNDPEAAVLFAELNAAYTILRDQASAAPQEGALSRVIQNAVTTAMEKWFDRPAQEGTQPDEGSNLGLEATRVLQEVDKFYEAVKATTPDHGRLRFLFAQLAQDVYKVLGAPVGTGVFPAPSERTKPQPPTSSDTATKKH